MKIDKWSLELVHAKPHESFSSYLNIEVRFILEQVSLIKGHKVDFDRFKINNCYRDGDIMLAIQQFLRRQQQEALRPAIAKALEPADLNCAMGKPGVVNVKHKAPSTYTNTVSIDGNPDLREYTGYRFCKPEAERVETLSVSEIVGKELGDSAKEEVRQKIEAHNQKVIRELVESVKSVKKPEEVEVKGSAKLSKKKTGIVKNESVKVTTKITKVPPKTPRTPSRAKSATKKVSKSAKTVEAKKQQKRPKSAVTAKQRVSKTDKAEKAEKTEKVEKVAKTTDKVDKAPKAAKSEQKQVTSPAKTPART